MLCREDRTSVGSTQYPLPSARTKKQREEEVTYETPIAEDAKLGTTDCQLNRAPFGNLALNLPAAKGASGAASGESVTCGQAEYALESGSGPGGRRFNLFPTTNLLVSSASSSRKTRKGSGVH